MAQQEGIVSLSPYEAYIQSIKTDATRTDYLKALNYFMQFCKFTHIP
jgi:hypothetical protein